MRYILLILLVGLASGCTSSRSTSSNAISPEEQSDGWKSLPTGGSSNSGSSDGWKITDKTALPKPTPTPTPTPAPANL